jgi:RNA polymerase sigma-70 factor (ECF subfamily)
MIGAVREGNHEEQRAALERLTARYWRPAYAHLRAKGFAADDAHDLIQDFFEKWLRENLFGRARIERGRFRDFLLTSLSNFVRNALRDRRAQKRWPAAGFADDDVDALGHSDDPAREFVQTFISDMTMSVLAALEDEFRQSGKAQHFELFRRRIVEPALEGVEPASYRSLAAEFGLSEKQAANCVTTARRAYRRLLEARIAEYAASPEDRALEMRELLGRLDIAP